MLEIKDTIDIHPTEAMMILQQHTDNFGVFINYDRLLEIQSMVYTCQKPFLNLFRLMADNPTLTVDQTQTLTSTYLQRFDVPQSILIGKSGTFSSDEEVRNRIVDDPVLGDSVKTFAKLHNALSYYNGMLKNLKQYSNQPLCNKRDKFGNRMMLVRPKYGMLSTYRLQASDPSIQNISREFPELITEPNNYTLLRTDSGQIEPRIMYSHFIKDPLIKTLILSYNDAYYALLHFILMSIKEEMEARATIAKILKDTSIPESKVQEEMIKAIPKKPLTEEMRNSIKLAGLAAGYGSNLKGKVVPFAKEYVEKINNHPLRKAWQEDVENYVDGGGDTFFTPFGLPITPDETDKYKKDTIGWKNHVVRCGINNPIQATASQLMCESVKVANRILRGSGSHIAYYKHDEGAFYIHKTEEHFLKELESVTAYAVRDWIPIYSDPLVGIKTGSGFGSTFEPEDIDKEIARVSKLYGLSA